MTTRTTTPTSRDDAQFREECHAGWLAKQEPVGRQLRLLLGVIGTALAIVEQIKESHSTTCRCRFCRSHHCRNLLSDAAGFVWPLEMMESVLSSNLPGPDLASSGDFGQDLRELAELADAIDAMEIADEPVIVGQK